MRSIVPGLATSLAMASVVITSSGSLFLLSELPANAQFNGANLSQLPALLDFESRGIALDKKINDALSAGRLTPAEAQPFKQELVRLKSVEAGYKASGKFSFFQKARLTLEMDVLSGNIEKGLHERTAIGLTDISGKKLDISTRLTDAQNSGRLTNMEVARLQRSLANINAKEASYTSTAPLTSTQTLEIALDLDRLSSSIESQLKARTGSDFDFAVRTNELATRISDLLGSRKITQADADEYRSELSRISSRQVSMTTSGKLLTTEEQLSLALDMEKLNSALERSSATASGAGPGSNPGPNPNYPRGPRGGHNGPANNYPSNNGPNAAANNASTSNVAFDARQAKVLARLESAHAAGRIADNVYLELKVDLDRLESRDRLYKADGATSESEMLALNSELEQVSARLQRSTKALPDLASRKNEMSKQIEDALASGRLTAAQADDFRKELSRVRRLEDAMRAGGGQINDQQVSAILRELDDVSSKLSNAVIPLPDINGRQSAITRKLNDAEAAATLNSSQLSDLRKESNRIKSVEASFRNSEGGLSDWEAMKLNRDLDSLESDMSRLIAAAPPAAPISNSSVPFDTKGHWAESYVGQLTQRGIIGGFPDGSFKPDDGITRAQFAAIAVKALALPAASGPANFGDVSPSYWANRAIAAVSQAGLVTGFPDGTFKPEDKITRAQALVILAKALPAQTSDTSILNSYGDGASVPAWAAPSVAKAARAHILVSYPDPSQIKPNVNATRADVAALTYQTLNNLGKNLPQIRVGIEPQ